MSLFWLFLLSCGLQHVRTEGRAKNLECYNDYDQEMVCTWEVENLTTSCRDQYLLKYERWIDPWPNNKCIPENVKVGDSISFSKCTCTIRVPYFTASDDYNIEILYNETVLLNDTIIPSETIKPKAPRNLTVIKKKDGFVLHWDKNYEESSSFSDKLGFEVTYCNKQNPKKNHTKMLNQLQTFYEILTSELDPGDYAAKVRSMPMGYGGQWSEWSPITEWHKDYVLSPTIITMIHVPIVSTFAVALVIISYFCFGKYKRELWDNIPDPAKSTFAMKNFNKLQPSVLRKKQHVCEQEASSHSKILKHMRNNFGNWLSKCIPFSLGETCLHDGYTHEVDKCGADNCQCKSKTEGHRAAIPEEAGTILIPERTSVERLLICPLETADIALLLEEDCETLEDKDTEEAKDNSIFVFDSCIQHLFLNILGTNTWQTNSDTFVDKYKLCNSHETESANQQPHSQPLSFFMDDCSLQQNYRKNFVPSLQPLESSHHDCKHEVQEDLFKLMLGFQSLSNPEVFSGGLQGFTHEPNMFFDADYHSFDSSVSRSEDKAAHVECCPTNMDFGLMSSQVGEGLMPTRRLHEVTHQKISNSMSPADSTVLNMTDYQSFDNAVKQDKMQGDQTVSDGSPDGTIPEESGYKPFDCASLQSTYSERGIDPPDLYVGKDLECDCSDSHFPLYFNETYKNNEQNDEIGDSRSGSINQHCNNTLNKRTLDRNGNVVYAMTFDICDHLKNFGNISTGDPLFNKGGSSLDRLLKLADKSPTPFPGIAKLPLLQQKKSLETAVKDQAMVMLKYGLCIPSVDSPPFQKGRSPFSKRQTKFENISYFIQPSSTENILGLKHNQVPQLDESSHVKHYWMGLKEEDDGEGNFYMEVTTQMDLQQLDTIKRRKIIYYHD